MHGVQNLFWTLDRLGFSDTDNYHTLALILSLFKRGLEDEQPLPGSAVRVGEERQRQRARLLRRLLLRTQHACDEPHHEHGALPFRRIARTNLPFQLPRRFAAGDGGA